MASPQTFHLPVSLTTGELIPTINPKFSLSEELAKATPRAVYMQHFHGCSLSLNGHFNTDGIIQSSQFKTHSFCFELATLDDAMAIDVAFEETLSKYMTNQNIDDWAYRSPFKQDNQVWLKLKHDDNKTAYRTTSNVKIHPKKPSEAPFKPYGLAEIQVEVSAYFSTKDKVYGYNFNVVDIQVK